MTNSEIKLSILLMFLIVLALCGIMAFSGQERNKTIRITPVEYAKCERNE